MGISLKDKLPFKKNAVAKLTVLNTTKLPNFSESHQQNLLRPIDLDLMSKDCLPCHQ